MAIKKHLRLSILADNLPSIWTKSLTIYLSVFILLSFLIILLDIHSILRQMEMFIWIYMKVAVKGLIKLTEVTKTKYKLPVVSRGHYPVSAGSCLQCHGFCALSNFFNWDFVCLGILICRFLKPRLKVNTFLLKGYNLINFVRHLWALPNRDHLDTFLT